MNNGGPAFPCASDYPNGCESQSGMSLRDWFAGMALQGLLAGRANIKFSADAQKAYEIADAMIAEREK